MNGVRDNRDMRLNPTKKWRCVWLVVLLLSCVKVCENLSSPEVDLDSYIPQSVWDKWITVLFVGILMSLAHLVCCALIGISACFVCN